MPTVDQADAEPTVDRLAPPPTAENPTQADEGAQLYWLNCQPCHGDRGQGLTDEWRAQYPPEDQNCWNSGCHGDRPYEDGFTLPQSVPPVLPHDSLQRFETGAQLYAYMRASMPYQAPGNLSEEEYLAITAFLAREHGVWDGNRPLRAETVEQVRFRPPADPTPESAPAPPANPVDGPGDAYGLALLLLVAAPILLGGLWLWRRYRHS